MQNIKLTLIGTNHCHLCEQAAAIVDDAIKSIEVEDRTYTVNQIDIMDDDALYEQYAIKIPVLMIQENGIDKIIYWPFTQQDVTSLIRSIQEK